MKKILISACLAGETTRYDGKTIPVTDPVILRWIQENRLVRVCPEIMGGLPVPRPPAEILGGTGSDVLDNRARVIDCQGNDVTRPFVDGAHKALALAREHGIVAAVLKQTSPSCGMSYHYDGSFTGTRRKGRGVCAALFARSGIRVFSENETQAVEPEQG